jgi:chemotaxis protein CheX
MSEHLSEITREVFQSMLSLEVASGEALNQFSNTYSNTVSGMVGMTGLFKGALAIHASHEVAKKITSQLLFMEVEEVNEDVLDAMGEMANMLAGNMKTALSNNGKDIELSVPSAVAGAQYSLDIKNSGEHMIVPFTTDIGGFSVQFNVEKQSGS